MFVTLHISALVLHAVQGPTVNIVWKAWQWIYMCILCHIMFKLVYSLGKLEKVTLAILEIRNQIFLFISITAIMLSRFIYTL